MLSRPDDYREFSGLFQHPQIKIVKTHKWHLKTNNSTNHIINLSSINIVNTAFLIFDWKFPEIFEQYRDIARRFRGIYGKKKKVLKRKVGTASSLHLKPFGISRYSFRVFGTNPRQS